MNKAIAVAIISTFMVVLSLYAVNAIIVEQQKDRQREISHTLLRYSEDLTQNIASTLKNTSAKGCDNASLNPSISAGVKSARVTSWMPSTRLALPSSWKRM